MNIFDIAMLTCIDHEEITCITTSAEFLGPEELEPHDI